MESEIEHLDSRLFDKKKFQMQLDIIKNASEAAQAKIDYFSAHDDNIIRAIEIIEQFLKKKHRLCYGGQAINAHLPAKYKFYDPDTSIPDYDFFTPDQTNDINIIIKDLKVAGFIEISVREGMHEGTLKIYVDFIPVADLTSIDPQLYKILSKREFKTDGISYLDANTLRMLMYLELSRPRGEVGRWTKVFERLSLFNEFIPIKSCRLSDPFHTQLTVDQLQFTVNFIIANKRLFAGANLLEFYNKSLLIRKLNNKWILNTKKPIIFFSPDATNDSTIIHNEFKILDKSSITVKSYSSKGIDSIPTMKIIYKNKNPIVFIIEQVACHSYFNIPIKGNIIKIASMDTLITLYFSLGLIDSKFFDIGSMECLANKLVEISLKARSNPRKFPLPFISIKCTGYQKTIPSLIREKVQRITQKRQQIKDLVTKHTNKRHTNKRHTNRRDSNRRDANRLDINRLDTNRLNTNRQDINIKKYY